MPPALADRLFHVELFAEAESAEQRVEHVLSRARPVNRSNAIRACRSSSARIGTPCACDAAASDAWAESAISAWRRLSAIAPSSGNSVAREAPHPVQQLGDARAGQRRHRNGSRRSFGSVRRSALDVNDDRRGGEAAHPQHRQARPAYPPSRPAPARALDPDRFDLVVVSPQARGVGQAASERRRAPPALRYDRAWSPECR